MITDEKEQKYDNINADDIRDIKPCVDKFGKPMLYVSFWDDEFCVLDGTFCERIEKI